MSLTISRLGIVDYFIASDHSLLPAIIDLHITTSSAMTSLLIIEYVLTYYGSVIGFVDYLYITMPFGFTRRTVINDVISLYILLWRCNR